MKVPSKINTYCPKCDKKTTQKVKRYKKGRTRSTSKGQRRHNAKKKGYKSTVDGKTPVYKQAKTPTAVLTCTECGKKQYRNFGSRSKKRLEVEK